MTSTSIYTVPSLTTAIVVGLAIANVANTGFNLTATAVHYDGTNTTNIVKNAAIDSGGTLLVAGGSQKLVLQANDQIKINTNATNGADVILSYIEVT